jgi:hypothetical protein
MILDIGYWMFDENYKKFQAPKTKFLIKTNDQNPKF